MCKTTRIRATSLLVVAAGLAGGSLAEAEGTLTVLVWNLQNDGGRIGCSLYSEPDGFPSDARKAKARAVARPSSGTGRCSFERLEPGTYAVSVVHDENEDGQLGTDGWGRPTEGWGVSNDVPARRFGPPRFEEATFHFEGRAKTVRIRLRR